jgi:hypothetical protein
LDLGAVVLLVLTREMRGLGDGSVVKYSMSGGVEGDVNTTVTLGTETNVKIEMVASL